MNAIDDANIKRLITAHQLLIEVSDDQALWNKKCDRANQNANNALAHVTGVLMSLGFTYDEGMGWLSPSEKGGAN